MSFLFVVLIAHIAVIQCLWSPQDKTIAHPENINFLESFSVQNKEALQSTDKTPFETNEQDRSLQDTAHETTLLISPSSTATIPTRLMPIEQKINPLSKKNTSALDDKAPLATTHSITPPTAHASILNNPPPPYPKHSRRLGEQGKVLLAAEIATNGKALQALVHISSGYPRLDRAAIASVLNWRFIPGKKAGVPEKMWVNIPINFVLE